MTDSVVLLSGGLDSAVALAMQLGAGSTPHALTVHYGQRHYREIDAAKAVAAHYGVPNTVINVDPALFGHSALTSHTGVLPTQPATEPDATYVPARNTVLLAMAAAFAESVGATRIVIGANADDAAGYPDCRPEYIEAFRDVLQFGTLGHVWVQAPLLHWSKADVVRWAEQHGVPIELTWSCYYGGEQPCGNCGACQLREAASA